MQILQIGVKICAIAAVIEKHKSIIRRKEKYDKIVLLAENEVNTIEVFDSSISHDEFVSVNNVLTVQNDMKAEIKSPNNK